MKASEPIILIDNDQAWLETLSEYLQDKGFFVETAEGPLTGLQRLEAEDIHVAVIDFEMPEMNGLELLRAIRERRHFTVVLLLSSEEDPRLAERARQAGAQAFLSKTMKPNLLLRELVQILTVCLTLAAMWKALIEHFDRLLPAPEPERRPLLLPWFRGNPELN